MGIIQLKNVSFRYPEASQQTLQDISLDIEPGEFVVIAGPSGCGKTTLLRLLKRELAPVGEEAGLILFQGNPINEVNARTLVEKVGYVSQDPDNQIVMDEVMQEIVFGLENLQHTQLEMRKRVAELVHFFGVAPLLQLKPSVLSGGQKQLINLLSVLLMKPDVLLLDEPTSQLDPVAARELITMLERLNSEMGMTIILVEHRLDELFGVADRIIFMNEGKIHYAGKSRAVIHEISTKQDPAFLPYVPSVARLYLSFDQPIQIDDIPLTVKESKQWLRQQSIVAEKVPSDEIQPHLASPALLTMQDVFFRYGKKDEFVLKRLSFTLYEGDFLALVGGNGSGKTTLLKTCFGACRPQRGKVTLKGRNIRHFKGTDLAQQLGYLPQNPRAYFVHETVEQEYAAAVERAEQWLQKKVTTDWLERFGIAHLKDRHPADCSGGEQQKAALACLLVGEPRLLLIDEPTKGLDPVSKRELSALFKKLHDEGMTVLMVTHDIEFAAKNATNCALLFDGEITTMGTPHELFQGNYFYTTAINRATRGEQVPEVLTFEEAIERWHVPVYP